MSSSKRNATGENFRKEVLLTGFGGQGIVLAGLILGRAASLGDKRESTLTQSYGPEARGGACSAQVIISGETIHYPYVRNADIVVCMSQGGYDKYGQILSDEGILIVDQDLVQLAKVGHENLFSVPATRMAEEMGRKMMANIVMLGFFTAVTAAVSLDAARSTVEASVPKGTEQMNIKAFNRGYDFGLATLKGRQKKAAGMKGVN
jgi:2-oxoglutarate ferredoxin oxidoreductase subunit gamma